MKIIFVGVERKYRELHPDYISMFNRFHLEIPWYYAKDGGNDVTVETVDYDSDGYEVFPSGGSFRNATFENASRDEYDVVVHWRKLSKAWLGRAKVSTMNTCDHSYSDEWKLDVVRAYESGQLDNILCFRTWHKHNLSNEVAGRINPDDLLTDFHLGVDTDIYSPSADKDPYQMLWASDPGRGLRQAMELAARLFQRDDRFRLHVCYPDYVPQELRISHPALVWHANVPNGLKLWDLFNSTGVLPYTSNFQEPSSRAHRQAMAAGSLVLYPPGRGSPSELIQNHMTGIVEPVGTWVDRILELVGNGEWKNIGQRAREYAISENWEVCSKRFNETFGKLLEEKR